MTDETYNGWTNRETWAVALYINNDQGWQESVHEALRAYRAEMTEAHEPLSLIYAGHLIQENVEEMFDVLADGGADSWESAFALLRDIGSLWRVNWDELGKAFLSDLAELES